MRSCRAVLVQSFSPNRGTSGLPDGGQESNWRFGCLLASGVEWASLSSGASTPLSRNDRNCQPDSAEKGHRFGNLRLSCLPKSVNLVENKVLICLPGR